MIDVQQVVDAVRASTKTKTVCVPSSDYYRRPGDWTEDTISYVCPEALIEELQQLESDDA